MLELCTDANSAGEPIVGDTTSAPKIL